MQRDVVALLPDPREVMVEADAAQGHLCSDQKNECPLPAFPTPSTPISLGRGAAGPATVCQCFQCYRSCGAEAILVGWL